MKNFIYSALAIAVIVAIGSVAGALSLSHQAMANNGLTVSASPSSGTLIPGQSLDIIIGDPTGTTDAVSDSCLVNDIDVNDTFRNVGPGEYRYTYDYEEGDDLREPGTIPIDCTLHAGASVQVTAF